MELDRTLLAFDYLNGEPVTRLDQGVPDPIGPSGGAAAFDRDAFLAVGGFDEKLFAYWEDVDLVLRMRLDGGSCGLAADARGVHEHSATLGSGSATQELPDGLRTRLHAPQVGRAVCGRGCRRCSLRELAICAGQAVVDRNLAGVRGRVQGLRSSPAREPYPSSALLRSTPTLASTLARRWRRRARLRAAGWNASIRFALFAR